MKGRMKKQPRERFAGSHVEFVCKHFFELFDNDVFDPVEQALPPPLSQHPKHPRYSQLPNRTRSSQFGS